MTSNNQIQLQSHNKQKIISIPSSDLTIQSCLSGTVIRTQLKLHGAKVYEELVDHVTLCAEGLGVNQTARQLALLVADIVECYPVETMEDIIIVLKQGRQGAFGTTYKQLNMIVFREWMTLHLELKLEQRDQLHQHGKTQGNQAVENIPYGDFIHEDKDPMTPSARAELKRQAEEIEKKKL